jgi:hypothetical protein
MNTTFDWIKHINYLKTPKEEFTSEDFEKFNSYVMHRVISMDPNLIELANEIQILPPQNKKEIYSIYKEFIPKNNKWNKYLKSSIKEPNKDLVNHLSDHFQISSREVKEYLNMLDSPTLINILTHRGLDKKEIKTLLK